MEIKKRKGLTIVELLVAMVIAIIPLYATAMVISGNQKSWNHIYNRVNNGIMTDSYAAKASFESICEKSSRSRLAPQVGTLGGYIEVYYYEPWDASQLNAYSRFSVQNGSLIRVYGSYDLADGSKTISGTDTIANNVDAVKFSIAGNNINMILHLDNGSERTTITSSSIRQSE